MYVWVRATFWLGWVAIWIVDRSLSYFGGILHMRGLSLFCLLFLEGRICLVLYFSLETVNYPLPPFALPLNTAMQHEIIIYSSIHRTPDNLSKRKDPNDDNDNVRHGLPTPTQLSALSSQLPASSSWPPAPSYTYCKAQRP